MAEHANRLDLAAPGGRTEGRATVRKAITVVAVLANAG
jgi:hypothetical protein